jgi:tetratricopeptide (TPR) repeat protein
VIGSREELTPRVQELTRRWQVPGVAADFERVDVRDPFGLLMSFVADESSLPSLIGGAEIQTDDRTRLEFSGPWGLQERGDPSTWLLTERLRDARPEIIRDAEAQATASQWRDRARMLLGAGAAAPAYDAAARALTFDPTDVETLALTTKTSALLGRFADGIALLDRMRARAPDSLAPLLELSRLRALAGDEDGAVEAATAATRRFPDAFESWQQLATLFADRRDETQLAQTFESMQAQFPDRWETRYFEAMLSLLRGEVSVAVNLGEQVLKERASDPRTLSLLGTAYARLGIHARARDALEARIQSNPRDPDSYVQLARLELDTYNPPRAAALFSEALVLDPRSPSALRGLADALSKMGRADRAAELRARAGS